ncbi:MAG: DUF1801 domain-containing protein [Anaerolineales bacterium]|nr:DUF1801 domain-containing protein [Anaerolineales bacterium]
MSPAKPTQDPATLQEVENFLAGVPAEQRSALERLRDQIRAAAPEAIEMISYGVPAFKYKGRSLVSYAAAKSHCSFFVQSPAVMEAHVEMLAGYNISKDTVRFQPEQPLPEELVHTLVLARMAETNTKA